MDNMSLGIFRILVLIILIQYCYQAALLEDIESESNESILRMKQMGVRVKFLQDNCRCEQTTCQCCLEGSLPQLNITQQFCMIAEFISENLELQVNATLNGNTLGIFMLSGRNPPPLCFTVPLPVPIPLSMCIRVKDIYPEGNNVHFCVDMMMRFAGFTFLTLPLNCMRIGLDGVQLVNQK